MERVKPQLAMEPATHACRLVGRKGRTLTHHTPKHPTYSPLDTCRYHRDAAASSLSTPLPLLRTVARRLIARPSPPSAARRTQSTASERSGTSAHCLPPLPATSFRVLTLRLQAMACDSTRSDWRYWQCGEPVVFVGDRWYTYGYWLHTGYWMDGWTHVDWLANLARRTRGATRAHGLHTWRCPRTRGLRRVVAVVAVARVWASGWRRAAVHPVRLADYSEGT